MTSFYVLIELDKELPIGIFVKSMGYFYIDLEDKSYLYFEIRPSPSKNPNYDIYLCDDISNFINNPKPIYFLNKVLLREYLHIFQLFNTGLREFIIHNKVPSLTIEEVLSITGEPIIWKML